MEAVAVLWGEGLLVDANVRAIIPAAGGGGGGGSRGDMERMLTVMLILMVVIEALYIVRVLGQAVSRFGR
jgi:hypothetical protein